MSCDEKNLQNIYASLILQILLYTQGCSCLQIWKRKRREKRNLNVFRGHERIVFGGSRKF